MSNGILRCRRCRKPAEVFPGRGSRSYWLIRCGSAIMPGGCDETATGPTRAAAVAQWNAIQSAPDGEEPSGR